MITSRRTAGMILGYIVYQVTMNLALNLLEWWIGVLVTEPAYRYIYFDKGLNMSFSAFLPGVREKMIKLDGIQDLGRLVTINMVNPILYGTIVIATILLIIAFRRSIRERKSLTDKTKGGNSAKETRLVQSVIAVCVIFIVTSSPRNVIRIMDLLNIRWRISPVYPYLPYIDNLVDFLEAVNHSINIFVYLSMNSKFRGRFKGLFGFTSVVCTTRQ